jgi:hypothetical protein
MTPAWPFLVALTPIIARFARDVIALLCDAARRASIERIVRVSSERTRIVDRSSDGAVLEIEISRTESRRTRSHDE